MPGLQDLMLNRAGYAPVQNNFPFGGFQTGQIPAQQANIQVPQPFIQTEPHYAAASNVGNLQQMQYQPGVNPVQQSMYGYGIGGLSVGNGSPAFNAGMGGGFSFNPMFGYFGGFRG